MVTINKNKAAKNEAAGFDAKSFAAEAENRPAAKTVKKPQPTSFLMPALYRDMLEEMSDECGNRVTVMKAALLALNGMSEQERAKHYMWAMKKTD